MLMMMMVVMIAVGSCRSSRSSVVMTMIMNTYIQQQR